MWRVVRVVVVVAVRAARIFLMSWWLAVVAAVVVVAAAVLFVARRVVPAWRLSRGFDAFGEVRKRRTARGCHCSG